MRSGKRQLMLLTLLACTLCMLLMQCEPKTRPVKDKVWHAPDTSKIPRSEEGERIRYGRSLVSNTAYYFGPGGTVASISNGMNCQNCHLDAGTRPWANNFSAVAATYPRFHERSGSMQTVEKKIKDCFERSMNGIAPDSSGREMQAMVAYIRWLGKGITRQSPVTGTGTHPLSYPGRAADPARGRIIYFQKCAQCHGPDGQGAASTNGVGYLYPPLWGANSYNTAASMFRLSKFAAYISDNMPLSGTGIRISGTDAWDVAAYVNGQPRTDKRFKEDWPLVQLKPVDYPFGPYADTFSEWQHKYGPFGPIKKAH